MLNAQGLWAWRDLYHATPAVTRDLGYSSLIQRIAQFSRLLGHTKGCGRYILTRILTLWNIKLIIYRPWNVQVYLRNVPYRSVQETNHTLQEAYCTMQEAYCTVKQPYRSMQKAHRTVQELYRTVLKAYRTVQSVQDNLSANPAPKVYRTVQIITWPLFPDQVPLWGSGLE
jgi:hypothetical protein